MSTVTGKNDVLGAFINQTYGSVEKAHQADKDADLRIEAEKRLCQEREAAGLKQFNSDQSILKSMNIPHKVKPGDLDDKTVPHEHFKDYDHSCEQVRKVDIQYGNPEGFMGGVTGVM